MLLHLIKEEKVHTNLSAMLPIWRDNSKSPSSIKHSLKVIKKAVNYLNSCQSPVVAFDQPLFEISKKIQWDYSSEFGMSKIVIMLGSLHIEMAMMSIIGDWHEDNGWTIALSNAKVTSSGNQSLLTGHDVAQTKYVHQVTTCCLYQLLHAAFSISTESAGDRTILFDNWRSGMEKKSVQFQFWSVALKMELDYLLFLRSIRSGDFNLYKYTISKFLSWLFALDLYHYARWLSIHLYDMEMLD